MELRLNNENCRICGSKKLVAFLERYKGPVHQNLLFPSQVSAIGIERGDIQMAVCEDCGFVFNVMFDDSKLSYGSDYDNSQDCSPTFNAYLKELARYLLEDRSVQNCAILEVGCGKGVFLKQLVGDGQAANTGHGFDPSYTGPPAEYGGRLKFERRYFDHDCENVHADVVICRHVIEHVRYPLQLLGTIRKALDASKGARVFFETPCVEWIFSNRAIWDFFYEHCSLFSSDSLRKALEKADFHVDEVKHVFGGQYLWLEGTVGGADEKIKGNGESVVAAARQYSQTEAGLLAEWKHVVRSLVQSGKVSVWGAGAKGVTFVNLVDPDREYVDCIVDLNPNKQGHFVPGSGHPIVGFEELASRRVTTAILMNPNYLQENERLLQEAGIRVDLVAPNSIKIDGLS